MKKIAFLRTGGQTGVDRAALDFARENDLSILGRCPKNGRAEDMPTAPGIGALCPELQETPPDDAAQQARWNVRDSHATLVIDPRTLSSSDGMSVAAQAAKEMGRPLLVVRHEQNAYDIVTWLMMLGNELTLNIDGPSASECPEAYQIAKKILEEAIRLLKEAEARGNMPIIKNPNDESEENDPKFLEALKVVIKEGRASIASIQRKCGIGYNHAGRIIERMERMGYVTPFGHEGTARAVLVTQKDFIAKYGEWEPKQ